MIGCGIDGIILVSPLAICAELRRMLVEEAVTTVLVGSGRTRFPNSLR